MSTRTLEERIAELQEKQDQYKAREARLQAKKRIEDRKARTRRLITVGATIESILGKQLSGEDLDILGEKIRHLDAEQTDFQMAAGQITEDVLGRKLTEQDLYLLRRFLEAQEDRGGYFCKMMNME